MKLLFKCRHTPACKNMCLLWWGRKSYQKYSLKRNNTSFARLSVFLLELKLKMKKYEQQIPFTAESNVFLLSSEPAARDSFSLPVRCWNVGLMCVYSVFTGHADTRLDKMSESQTRWSRSLSCFTEVTDICEYINGWDEKTQLWLEWKLTLIGLFMDRKEISGCTMTDTHTHTHVTQELCSSWPGSTEQDGVRWKEPRYSVSSVLGSKWISITCVRMGRGSSLEPPHSRCRVSQPYELHKSQRDRTNFSRRRYHSQSYLFPSEFSPRSLRFPHVSANRKT